MKTKDSAIQWIEINLLHLARDTGGTLGNTEAHRRALHIFNGLVQQYAAQVAEASAEDQRLREAGAATLPGME